MPEKKKKTDSTDCTVLLNRSPLLYTGLGVGDGAATEKLFPKDVEI